MRKSHYLRTLRVAIGLSLCVHFAVAQETEADYADFPCLTAEQQAQFRGPNNAVCYITWLNAGHPFEATGTLINNTNKDGRILILTAAHNLPSDAYYKLLPFDQMDESLKLYIFAFFHERTACGTDKPINPAFAFVGAKLLGIYASSNTPEMSNPGPLNTDVALLELLQKPD